MSNEPAGESTSSESVSRAPWLLPLWLDRRRDVLKGLMSENKEEAKDIPLRKLFFSHFDEDLEYCDSEQLKRGEPENEQKNFYNYFLKMLRHMPNKSKNEGSYLRERFIKNYSEWVEDRGIQKQMNERFLTAEIQEEVMEITFSMSNVFECLESVFGINLENQREMAKKTIKKLQEKDKHQEALNIAINYRLVDDYSLEDLLLPALLSNKTQVVIDILVQSKKMQKAYIRFLDSFVLKSEQNVDEYFAPFKENMKITTDRFKSKGVYAMIQRFFNGPVKQLKFDLEEARDAPNFDFQAKRNALRYYAYERFEDGKMPDAVYFQNVCMMFEPFNTKLFTGFLMDSWRNSHKDLRIDAISWMIYYDVSEFDSCIPYAIREFFERPKASMVNAAYRVVERRKSEGVVREGDELFTYEEEKKYPIRMITTKEKLEELIALLEKLEQGEKPVSIGYDSEMKHSHFMVKNSITVALIQLCIGDTVYVIDCVQLEKLPDHQEVFMNLIRHLAFTKNISLIGFDVYNDIDRLFDTNFMKNRFKREDVQKALCLKTLIENVAEHDEQILKMGKKTCRLYEISDKILGKELDKSEQQSNWEARPLRKKQVVYAATDAVVVVELFEKVVGMAKERGMDEGTLIKECNLVNRREKQKEKKENKAEKAAKSEMCTTLSSHRDPSKPLQRPSELRVIVDMMLGSLANSLRRMGVDVIFPKNPAERKAVCEENQRLAEQEKRFVVTCVNKNTATMLAEQGSHLIVLDVPNDQPKINIVFAFLDRFNLDIREEEFDLTSSSKSNESVLSQ